MRLLLRERIISFFLYATHSALRNRFSPRNDQIMEPRSEIGACLLSQISISYTGIRLPPHVPHFSKTARPPYGRDWFELFRKKSNPAAGSKQRRSTAMANGGQPSGSAGRTRVRHQTFSAGRTTATVRQVLDLQKRSRTGE